MSQVVWLAFCELVSREEGQPLALCERAVEQLQGRNSKRQMCNQAAWGLKSRFPNLRFHPIAELQLSERRASPKLPLFV